jgi:hypothetical protein
LTVQQRLAAAQNAEEITILARFGSIDPETPKTAPLDRSLDKGAPSLDNHDSSQKKYKAKAA